jgi:hypothetical protein
VSFYIAAKVLLLMHTVQSVDAHKKRQQYVYTCISAFSGWILVTLSVGSILAADMFLAFLLWMVSVAWPSMNSGLTYTPISLSRT